MLISKYKTVVKRTLRTVLTIAFIATSDKQRTTRCSLSQVEVASLTDSSHVVAQREMFDCRDNYSWVTCCFLDSDSRRQACTFERRY